MINNKPGIFSLRGFIKLTRFPNLLIIALSQYFTTIFLIDQGRHWKTIILDYHLFLLSLSTILIAAAGYIINDYYDVKIDFVNKPDRVVVDKVLKRRVVMVAHSVLNVLGIGIGSYLSLKIGAINFLSAGLLWLYSNQLKRIPLIGNIAVSVLTGMSLIIVAIYAKQSLFLVGIYAIFAFSITLIREIVKDIEDVKGDAVFGCKTLPIVFGIRKTKVIIYLLSAIFVALLFYLATLLQNEILTLFFVVLIVPLSYFIYRLVKADTQRDFAFLSSYCKVIMLSGIFSMIFFSA